MCLARSLQTAPPAIERSNKSKSQDQDGQHDDSPLHRTPSFNVSSHRGLTSHSRLQNLNVQDKIWSNWWPSQASSEFGQEWSEWSWNSFFRSCLSWSKSCTSWFWAFTVQWCKDLASPDQGRILLAILHHLATKPLACVVWSVMWLQEEEEQEPEGPEVKASTNSVSVCSLQFAVIFPQESMSVWKAEPKTMCDKTLEEEEDEDSGWRCVRISEAFHYSTSSWHMFLDSSSCFASEVFQITLLVLFFRVQEDSPLARTKSVSGPAPSSAALRSLTFQLQVAFCQC